MNENERSQHTDMIFERRAALITSIGIVVLVAYLVVRNRPFQDPSLIVILRIILSLAIGVLGATIPGFLHIKYSAGGFVIRATGAIALFIISFFGTPGIEVLNLQLPEPQIKVSQIKQVDFRTKLGPDHSDQDRKKSSFYITVPLALQNSAQPSKAAFINSTRVSFTLDGNNYNFLWRNFVSMHEERYGLWLGIDGDAALFSVRAGETVYKEILHNTENEGLTWGAFLDELRNPKEQLLTITMHIDVDGKELNLSCKVDLSYWSNEINEFMQKNNKVPGRVTTSCI